MASDLIIILYLLNTFLGYLKKILRTQVIVFEMMSPVMDDGRVMTADAIVTV